MGTRRWPPYVRSAAISLLIALLISLVVAQNFLPNRLTLRAGDVSSQDVVAPRSARYESQTKRDEARAAAAKTVADQFDGSMATQQRQALDSLASKVSDLRQSSSSGPDRVARLSLLESQLSDAQRQYLLQADEGTIAAVFKNAGDILQALEANGIKPDTLKSAQDTARTRAGALHLDATASSLIASLVRDYLRVNYLPGETDSKRQQASDAVPPVFVTVGKGQTIIRYGDLVTPFQLEEAQAVGLLAPQADWSRILATFMLVVILFAVAFGYLMQFKPAIIRDPRQLLTLGGLMLVILLIGRVPQLTGYPGLKIFVIGNNGDMALVAVRAAIAQALHMEPQKVSVEHVEHAGAYGHNGADDAAFDVPTKPGAPVAAARG